MGNNSHHALTLAGFLGSRLKCRTQATLVLRDRALGMPSSTIDSSGKAVIHLAAKTRLRARISDSSRIDGNDRRANAQGFAADAMVPFGIVGSIAEEAMNRQVVGGLGDRRHKIGGVVAGPVAHRQGGDQVRAMVEHQRHLRVTPIPFHPPGASQKMAADVMTFQAGRVNGGFRSLLDQAALSGNTENSLEQSLESPFFRSRSWAF